MSYYDKDRDDAAPRITRYPGPGLNAVAEYQQAGRPFVQVAQPAEGHFNGNAGTEAFDDNGKLINIADKNVYSDEFRKTIGVAACDVDRDGYEEIYFLNTDTYSGTKKYSDRLLNI